MSAYTDKEGTPRPSADLTARQVLTEYHVARKRKAVSGAGDAEREQAAQGGNW